jgi:polyhydroxybutyrate depolymerase
MNFVILKSIMAIYISTTLHTFYEINIFLMKPCLYNFNFSYNKSFKTLNLQDIMNLNYLKMKKIFYSIIMMVLPLVSISQQTLTASFTHDGINRSYTIYIPAIYTGNTEVPLVLNFHGYGSNATQQMGYGDFRPIADTVGFIVVHPQGTELKGTTHWNVGGWTIGSTVDDVGFTEALIDTLISNYNIDPKRVYSTGMSNGGFMSFLLACQLSNKIAAIASVTGSMTPEIYNNCNPQHPTPIMQIHGTNDPTVPYNGDTWTKSIDDVIAYWVSYNNCSTNAVKTDIPNSNTTDGSTVELYSYKNGDKGVETQHYKVIDGMHTWPGTEKGFVGTNQDINASAVIWNFFSKYNIDGLINISDVEQDFNTAEIVVLENPVSSFLRIKTPSSKSYNYQLYHISGNLVLEGETTSMLHQVDISALSEGIYFLRIDNRFIKLLKL